MSKKTLTALRWRKTLCNKGNLQNLRNCVWNSQSAPGCLKSFCPSSTFQFRDDMLDDMLLKLSEYGVKCLKILYWTYWPSNKISYLLWSRTRVDTSVVRYRTYNVDDILGNVFLLDTEVSKKNDTSNNIVLMKLRKIALQWNIY